MRKIMPFAVMFSVVLLFSAAAAEAGPQYRFDPSSQKSREMRFPQLRAGYLTFTEVCKPCHFKGNAKGAPFLHTESMNMRAWNRVFHEKYPGCAKTGAWNGLSAEDLLRLNDYLYSNASDADNPFCQT